MEAHRQLRGIGDLAAGDHVAWVCASSEEYRAVLTPFLRLGLEREYPGFVPEPFRRDEGES